MKTDPFFLLTLLLVVAIAGVVGYKLGPNLSGHAGHSVQATPCNPSITPCSSVLPDGGRLTLSISPNPIRPLQPLHLEVTVTGSHAQRVEVDFSGTQMNMGYNRALLSGGNGRFRGEAILPVCITGTMEWKSTVLMHTASRINPIAFRFDVSPH